MGLVAIPTSSALPYIHIHHTCSMHMTITGIHGAQLGAKDGGGGGRKGVCAGACCTHKDFDSVLVSYSSLPIVPADVEGRLP